MGTGQHPGKFEGAYIGLSARQLFEQLRDQLFVFTLKGQLEQYLEVINRFEKRLDAGNLQLQVRLFLRYLLSDVRFRPKIWTGGFDL